MQWSIHDIARLSGTTSRTLRHYHDIGLLHPSSIGANGYRYYDEAALTRLQRILMLRDLGLGLPAIAEVLAGQTDDVRALVTHLHWLELERERVARQIASVTTTIRQLEGGEQLMAEDMFDGFDHTVYQDEVEQRWGADAYARSDRWWRELGAEGQAAFKNEVDQLQRGFAAAHAAGTPADDADVQALTARHYAWVRAGWGDTAPSAEAYLGLGDMYVADPRFAKHYGGPEAAEFVREAMRVYAASELA
ncbi:MAG: MerR family transcriptional regulator [Microcella sp.]|uniref:MerR family transcriptional regulator n=1 Tax=Microcella sp. TaxID=1913979 RepID=UPI0024CD9DBB|nr:MerR family transcriptional regulator [Microcella sp.]UYN82888.1 MAG: MerR family transcriptional regulator [Microcella sp.]